MRRYGKRRLHWEVFYLRRKKTALGATLGVSVSAYVPRNRSWGLWGDDFTVVGPNFQQEQSQSPSCVARFSR